MRLNASSVIWGEKPMSRVERRGFRVKISSKTSSDIPGKAAALSDSSRLSLTPCIDVPDSRVGKRRSRDFALRFRQRETLSEVKFGQWSPRMEG